MRAGYDAWAPTYDGKPNPLVLLDRRHTLAVLAPAAGERILDVGCGTGGHLDAMLRAGSRPHGLDLSRGMLDVARRRLCGVALAQADLDRTLPVKPRSFDAVLCALVSEHLAEPATLCREAFLALRPGGRFVFSAFHPEMALAGIEANFVRDDVEYRLGAERHRVEDYAGAIEAAGFRRIRVREFLGDDALVAATPSAAKYLGRPLLLLIDAQREAA